MVDDVWRWCETRSRFGRTVTVKIKYGDFKQITRRRSQAKVVATLDNFQNLARDLIRSVLPPTKGIRLVGVTVSNFGEPPADREVALPMFAKEQAA
jgi:DNA polymerase-4